MSTAIAKDAPSHFASLLRRSKFASYDQRIGQVYTAYGGYAHRGDWGLKRPLPKKIRTRRPYISIGHVDSIHEQTEWDPRGPAARFMASWSEMGMDQVEVESAYKWSNTSDARIDSEFAWPPGMDPFQLRNDDGGASVPEQRYPIRNVDKMTPNQFERYLEQLRQLRPQFKQWLIDRQRKAQAAVDAKSAKPEAANMTNIAHLRPEELDMEALARESHNATSPGIFIEEQSSLSAGSDSKNWIEQRPHRFGGLTYAQVSQLQSRLMFAPVKGRFMNPPNTGNDKRKDALLPSASVDSKTVNVYATAVAGIVANVFAGASQYTFMDFGMYSKPDDDNNKNARRDSKMGIAYVRIIKAELSRMPQVVGPQPEDLKEGAKWYSLHAQVFSNHDDANPFLPGSPSWLVKRIGATARYQPLDLNMPQPKLPPAPTKKERMGTRQNVLQTVMKLWHEDGSVPEDEMDSR